MKRQLYYLIPDITHTHNVYEDLRKMNIADNRIHVVMKEKARIEGINDIHTLNEKDRDYYLEWFLLRLNLAIFILALIAFVGMAIWYTFYYMAIPFIIMVATLTLGWYITLRSPSVQWNEFISAVRHGEILLIVDVPESERYRVDHDIQQLHPELINGGVCWKT